MPRDILSRHPRVCIFYAASLMPIGRWDAALPVLQIAEENQELAPHTAVAAYVNALRSFQSTVRRDIDNAISHAKRAIEAVSSRSDITGTIPSSEDDILALSFATFSLSTAYTVSGMHVQANQILPDAVASNKEARNITMLVGALHRWFSNKVVQGRLHEALRICHEALETYQEMSKRIGDRRPRPSVELSIQADFGHIQYEWNRLNEAESHIAQALELYELGGTNSPGFRAYKMSALLKQARGDLEGSLLQLRKLDRLKPSVERAASTPLIEWEVLSMTLRLTLSSNFPEIDYLISEVAGWIEARQSQVDEEIEYYREPEYLILSWLRLVQGQTNEAIPILERLVHVAEESGRNGDLINYLALYVLARQNQGEDKCALNLLSRALALAEPEGYVRTFVDHGPPMQKLLELAVERSISPSYVSMLLDAFGQNEGQDESRDETATVLKPAPNSSVYSLQEELNEREMEVLRSMAAGLSNREIADRMYLSINTIKWHTSNIYGKLGVRRRAEAIARASGLGLLG